MAKLQYIYIKDPTNKQHEVGAAVTETIQKVSTQPSFQIFNLLDSFLSTLYVSKCTQQFFLTKNFRNNKFIT